MTLVPFTLVLISGFTHATWNFLAKRASGDITFVWLFNALGALIYFPLAVYLMATQHPVIGFPQLMALAISTVLHIAYYLTLTRGYRVGDLSLVYPLARGSGPLLSTLGAVLFLSERPPALVIVGTLLIVVGIVVLTGNPAALRGAKARPAIIYGLLTGLSVAAYTLWDKQLVTDLGIPPLILTWIGVLTLAILLTPYAWHYKSLVKEAWQNHRREAIGIGILDSLGYMMFLFALSLGSVSNPVSNLAPLRQSSILIGAFLGTRVLSEDAGRRRIAAALVMLAEIVVLALG